MDSTDLSTSPQSSISSLSSWSTNSSLKSCSFSPSVSTSPMSSDKTCTAPEPVKSFSYKLPTSFFQWSVCEDEYDGQDSRLDDDNKSIISGESLITSGALSATTTTTTTATSTDYNSDINTEIVGSGSGISCDKSIIEELLKTKPRRRFISKSTLTNSGTVCVPQESSQEVFLRRKKRNLQSHVADSIRDSQSQHFTLHNKNAAALSATGKGSTRETDGDLGKCGEMEASEQSQQQQLLSSKGKSLKLLTTIQEEDENNAETRDDNFVACFSRLRLGNKRRKTCYPSLTMSKTGNACLKQGKVEDSAKHVTAKTCPSNVMDDTEQFMNDDADLSPGLSDINISMLALNAAKTIQFTTIKNDSDTEDSDMETGAATPSVGNTFVYYKPEPKQKKETPCTSNDDDGDNDVCSTFPDCYGIKTSSILDHSEPDTCESIRLPLSGPSKMTTGNHFGHEPQSSFIDQGDYVEKFVGFKIRSTMFPKSGIYGI